MKKNKVVWVVLPIAGVLIAAIVVALVLVLSGQKKSQRYAQQMQQAQAYLSSGDYDQVVATYEAAIKVQPEEPKAYTELAQFYMDQGQFNAASDVAMRGWKKTKDQELKNMLDMIDGNTFYADDTDDSDGGVFRRPSDAGIDLLLRRDLVDKISEYCFQQYVDEFGKASIKFISNDVGYQVKFARLNAYAYFKNTEENPNAIDDAKKRPMPNAVPYKLELLSTSAMFAGYNGYVGTDQMLELFHAKGTNGYDKKLGFYYMELSYDDCVFRFETDKDGNLISENPNIIICPVNLVSDWTPEEEEEEPKEDTFVLAGQTYSYNVTEIWIENADLDDLSPLADCKKLQTLVLINCQISDLSPISGSTALRELSLEDSTGGLDLGCVSGLKSLKYLNFHECRDISDLSPVMKLDLEVLHPCGSSVSYEQVEQYIEKHPDCEVWFDYYCING